MGEGQYSLYHLLLVDGGPERVGFAYWSGAVVAPWGQANAATTAPYAYLLLNIHGCMVVSSSGVKVLQINTAA